MSENPTITVSPDDIKRLAELVEQNGLSELRYEQGDLRITLRTATYRPNVPLASPTLLLGSPSGEGIVSEAVPEPVTAADTPSPSPLDTTDLVRIEAPIMGVFYRAAKPDDPPFVDVGDTVEAGQVIGLIEAMKTFSEVPAEVAGVIEAVPVQNGSLVQPGDALMLLKSWRSRISSSADLARV